MKNKLNRFQKGFLLSALFFCSILFAQENEELYANSEEDLIIVLKPSYSTTRTNTKFEKKYHYLIARAYFKLLSDAEKSERKLRKEYERYSFENEKFDKRGNQVFQGKLNLAQKKYKAHSAMISGLKSWNLFNEYRTGDMFYFMEENEDCIFKMYRGKLSEDKMVRYLVYKLADLYHVAE